MKILKDYNPKNVKKAYKVFRVKDGKLYPPMVANANNEPTPIGVWLGAEEGAFAGLSKTGRPQVKSIGSGTLSYRPGWHLGDIPRAKQFDRLNKETGEVEFPKDFVWAECEYVADKDYQKDSDEQGHMRIGKDGKPYRSDKYQHSLAGLQKIPDNGYYKYRTNPNPDTVPWVITGAIKVDKLLSDDEVNSILKQNGIEPIHRQGGDKSLKELGLNESLIKETKSVKSLSTDDLLSRFSESDSIKVYDTPQSGSQYILPNGKFLFWGKDFIHSSLMEYIYVSILGGKTDDKGRVKDHQKLYYVMDYLEENLGWIRVNDNVSGYHRTSYIALDKIAPTQDQYNSLEIFLDVCYEKGNGGVEINRMDLRKNKTYSFDDYIADDIIKKIKQSYSSGVLYESLKEDINNKELSNEKKELIVKTLKDHFGKDITEDSQSYIFFPNGDIIRCEFHPDLIDYLCDCGLFTDEEAYIIDGMGASLFVKWFNCVRATKCVGENYIELPHDTLTSAQYSNILELLDIMSLDVDIDEVEISAYTSVRNGESKYYSFYEYTPDEILKKIKRYYASGVLYESLNEDKQLSKEETLKLMDDKFGQKELYLWSTYILPNGHFLNPDNGWDEFDDEPEYEHSDFIYNYYNDYGETLFDDCIKMNVNYPFLTLPKQPTQQQWNRVEEIIDNYDDGLDADGGVDDLFDWAEVDSEKERGIIRGFQRPLLIDLEGIGAKIVDASWGGREIVKEMKKAKSSGGFYESLKEDKNQKQTIIAYHGTNNKFDSFRGGRIDWFSQDLDLAHHYGDRIKKCEITFNNPIDVGEGDYYLDEIDEGDEYYDEKTNTLVPSNLCDIANKLGVEVSELIDMYCGDVEYCDAYGYDNVNLLLGQQYMITSEMAFGDLCRSKGYDCIIQGECDIATYGILNPNNIKILETLTEELDIEMSNVDSLGNELSAQQVEYFKDSKIRDAKGNLLVVYHGSATKGLEIFDANNQEGYKFEGEYVNFFTASEKVARTYMYDKSKDGELYSCYLNIEHPYYVKNRVKKKSERTWSNIKDSKTREMREILVDNFLDKWFGQDVTKNDIDKINKDLKYFGMSVVPSKDETNIAHRMFKRDDENLYNVHRENRVIPELSCLPLDKLFGKNPVDNKGYYTDEDWTMALEGYTMQDEEGNWAGQTTNDVIRCILYGNEYEQFKQGKYDGIIIRNIKDSANGDSNIPNSTIYVTIKSPNQIKRIDNKNPTDSNKINESKNDIEKFRQWAGEDLANKFFKLKDRLQGKQKDIYYWMGQEKQLGKNSAIMNLYMTMKELERKPTKKGRNQNAREGSEKVYEDANWLVLKINNYEASRKYGKGTAWCITGDKSDNGYDETEGRNYWNNYSDADIYFFVDKKNTHKYALVVYDINDWMLFDEMDFVDLGDGEHFEEAVSDECLVYDDIVRDYLYEHFKDLPKVKGLPDFEARFKYLQDHPEEFPGYVEESLKEEKESSKLDIVFDESSYEPVVIGGKEYSDEDYECETYYGILLNGEHIGNIALNSNEIEGFEIYHKFRKKGFGKAVIKELLKQHPDLVFVESIPEAKKFWEKVGFKSSYYDDDSGLYVMKLDKSIKESYESSSVYYRGYDSRYGVFDSGDKYSSLYTWLTDDFEYAVEYASENKYGKVAKIKLTCSEDDIGSLYDLPEECDYYDPGDDDFQEYILDEGLCGYDFYANDDESYCLCVSKDVCKVIDKDVKFDMIDEEMKDGKLIVYRVGKTDDFEQGLFFSDTLDYYDYSDTGYDKKDAIPYELDLKGAKVVDPIIEWDLDVSNWYDIRQTEEVFLKHNFEYYEGFPEIDYDDPEEYHEVYTDTDYLAQWAYENGYDVCILRDIPGSREFGDKSSTEYCVFNKNIIKPLKVKESLDEDKDSKTITAYHGSQDGNLELSEEPIYLTNDLELAEQFAMGYAFNFDLLDSDDPTVYEIEVSMSNPLYIKTEDEYDTLMDITNIEETKKYLDENNYDGIIYQDEEYEPDTIYYMPLNAKKQCKIVDKVVVDLIPQTDDAEVEAQQLSTYEAFMNLKGEDDE